MKKAYSKPELFAESFQLMEHISSGCETAMGYANSHQAMETMCAFKFDGKIFFDTDLNGKCNEILDADDAVGPINCYNQFNFQVFAFQTS